jgi:hypothetical protein
MACKRRTDIANYELKLDGYGYEKKMAVAGRCKEVDG